MIKGIKITERKRKEAVDKLMKEIGAEAKVEKIKTFKRNEEEETEMLWVKLEKKEQRREVMEKKKRLKGSRKKIMEDLT